MVMIVRIVKRRQGLLHDGNDDKRQRLLGDDNEKGASTRETMNCVCDLCRLQAHSKGRYDIWHKRSINERKTSRTGSNAFLSSLLEATCYTLCYWWSEKHIESVVSRWQ